LHRPLRRGYARSQIEPFHRYGELVEFAPTAELFSNPAESRTADYVSGKFG